MRPVLFGIIFAFALSNTAAAGVLSVQPVAEGVYAIVGPLTNRDTANMGDNATFGLVITKAGAVLIDSGGSDKGAALIESAIQTVTDKPVIAVINTGGQDHRWFGNGYFKARGATIYATATAVTDQKERYSQQAQGMEALIGENGLKGTTPVHADITFADHHTVSIGGTIFEFFPGAAHTPGDVIVWLASRRVAFTGDLVYVERLLGISAVSSLNDWLESFAVLESLSPKHVVPGHGSATTLARAQTDTRDYLLNLQGGIRKIIQNGQGDRAAVAIDQNKWAHLLNFDLLAKRNALAAYYQLEFE